jgi:hypothetical protein
MVSTTKITLEMPTKIYKNLELLAQESCSPSMAEMFRKAVTVYSKLIREVTIGGAVIVRGADGTEEEIIVR